MEGKGETLCNLQRILAQRLCSFQRNIEKYCIQNQKGQDPFSSRPVFIETRFHGVVFAVFSVASFPFPSFEARTSFTSFSCPNALPTFRLILSLPCTTRSMPRPPNIMTNMPSAYSFHFVPKRNSTSTETKKSWRHSSRSSLPASERITENISLLVAL